MGKKINPVVLLFIISWAALLAVCVFFIGLKMENLKLEDALSVSQRRMSAAEGLLKEMQNNRSGQEAVNQKTLDFLQWQFVVKDQVEDAGRGLKNSIKLISGKEKKKISRLIYYNLGLNFILASDFNSAIKAFEEALKYDSKDAQSYYNLGLLYGVYKNNPKKAVQCYKKYLEILPRGPKAELVKERIEDLTAALSEGRL